MEYAQKGFDVEYVNVKASAENMDRMLKASGGRRNVPVIIEGGMIIVGSGGT